MHNMRAPILLLCNGVIASELQLHKSFIKYATWPWPWQPSRLMPATAYETYFLAYLWRMDVYVTDGLMLRYYCKPSEATGC